MACPASNILDPSFFQNSIRQGIAPAIRWVLIRGSADPVTTEILWSVPWQGTNPKDRDNTAAPANCKKISGGAVRHSRSIPSCPSETRRSRQSPQPGSNPLAHALRSRCILVAPAKFRVGTSSSAVARARLWRHGIPVEGLLSSCQSPCDVPSAEVSTAGFSPPAPRIRSARAIDEAKPWDNARRERIVGEAGTLCIGH